jgi:hypothetical protein
VLISEAVVAEVVVVIANAELSELDEASLPLLRQLFLARRASVGGRRIHCFEPGPGSPARRTFTRRVLERSERELERHWLEQALAGGPPPPREIADEAALVKHVAKRPGALAYLEWQTLKRLPAAGVKVIRLRHEGRSLGPDDPAYPLRIRAPQAPGPAGRNTRE